MRLAQFRAQFIRDAKRFTDRLLAFRGRCPIGCSLDEPIEFRLRETIRGHLVSSFLLIGPEHKKVQATTSLTKMYGP